MSNDLAARWQKVFRGGTSNEITEKGLSVSVNRQVAKEFARARKGTLSELYISRKAKIIDLYDIPTLKDEKAFFEYAQANTPFGDKLFSSIERKYKNAVQWAKENGYDAVKFPTEGEIRVVNPDILKTKFQLDDTEQAEQYTEKAKHIKEEAERTYEIQKTK